MTTAVLVAAPPPPAILGLLASSPFEVERPPVSDATLEALDRLVTKAFDALDKDRETVRNSLIVAMGLLAPSRTTSTKTAGGPTTLAPWQAKRALTYIDEHLHATIRIAELAQLARVSASHFARAFKATFGRSPQQFIVDRRVERAQEVMLTSDEPLCGIALTCGFADQAHMSRVFHRRVGAPPNRWRRDRQVEPATLHAIEI
ncbi:helix-turn-helix domain-containing protein [Caulobacter sp. 1776]|uniref:helix-turn-helix domain-containing protein n=1 Tax=Caulobacter sp. 1776 TaxID=3156420 RepID=UPI003396BC33